MVVEEKDKCCETCKYYEPEFDIYSGVCLKDEEYPVPTEAYDTCDNWEQEE